MEFLDKIKGYLSTDTPRVTKFLDAGQQQQLINHLKNKVPVALFGGYQDAEMKRASIYQASFDITCFKIIYNKTFLTLTHQNILGSLLSLSITRDSIGDILPGQGIFFVTNEIQSFVKTAFAQIGNVRISLIEVDGHLVHSEQTLEHKTFTVDSLRLDAVVSKIIRKSRNEGATLIKSELVKRNHLVETRITKILSEQDVISIRNHGRFIILDTKHTSRKGKTIVKYGKYI